MRAGFVLSMMSVAAAGCLAEVDDAEPTGEAATFEPRLITAVTRANGNRFEFYADVDGELMMSETGPTTNAPSLTPREVRAANPLAIHRALTGGDAAPAELAELVAANPRLAARDARATLVLNDAPPLSSAAAGCSATWFDNNVCHFLIGDEWEWCRKNRTADDGESDSDANYIFATVCTDKGSVVFQRHLRTWWDWDKSSWDVDAGHYRWWSKTAGAADFDWRARVRDVGAGDKFHFAGYGCEDAVGPDIDLCFDNGPITR